MGDSIHDYKSRTLRRIFIQSQFGVAVIVIMIIVTLLTFENVGRLKKDLANHLIYMRDLFSQSLIPAIQFNDPKEAAATLKLLRADPNITRAVVYKDGKVFATFFSTSDTILPTELELKNSFTPEYFRHYSAVQDKDGRYGSIFLESSTIRVREEFESSILYTLLGSLLALLTSAVISILSVRSFIKPFQVILRYIKDLTIRGNYNLELPDKLEGYPSAEAAILYENFKNMIAEINQRDRFLNEANESLEAKVRERTAELREAQGQMIEDARKAGITDITTGILHNIANIMNSVTTHSVLISENLRDRSVLTKYMQVEQLIDENSDDLPNFFSEQGKSEAFIGYFKEVNKALEEDLTVLLDSTNRITDAANIIGEIIRHQQDLALGRQVDELIDIEHLCKRALYIKHSLISQSKVIVENKLSGVPRVLAQQAAIYQVFVNLISNACQALNENKSQEKILRISCDNDDEWIIVKFCDSGLGVSTEHLSNLFEQGFSTKQTGHGFGLHSCRKYLREFGGDITYSTSSLGGACFEVKIPNRQEN